MKKYIHYFKEDFEERGVYHKKGEIFGLTDTKNDEQNCIEVEIDQKQLDTVFDCIYKDGKLLFDEEGVLLRKKDALRNVRESELLAFDKYNTGVLRGIILETNEEKLGVLEWYKKALDLDAEAIENPPERIKYYL